MKGSFTDRKAHTDVAKYRLYQNVINGAGEMGCMCLLDFRSMDSYLKTLHQGTFHPQSGIKHCFHDHCEERFFIFEGEAQFRYCRPERAA